MRQALWLPSVYGQGGGGTEKVSDLCKVRDEEPDDNPGGLASPAHHILVDGPKEPQPPRVSTCHVHKLFRHYDFCISKGGIGDLKGYEP